MPIDLYEYDSPFFMFLLRFHEVLMVISLILSFYFVYQIRKVGVIHVNLRILLCNIPFCFILMNLTRFLAYTWENNAHKFEPIVANSVCLVFRLMEELGVGFLGVCIPQITFERAFATVFRSTYEKQGAKLGIGMTVQTYFASATLSSTMIAYQLFWAKDFKLEERYKTCRLESHYTFVYFAIWICAFFIACNATAFLFLAYHYNRQRHIQKNSLHLSTRYQFKENVQTLRSLLPPISFFMLSDVAGLVCICYAVFWHRTEHNIIIVLQLLHIIPQLFCIATILWFMFTFSAVRQRIIKDFGMLRLPQQFCRNKIGSSRQNNQMVYELKDTQDGHFSSLTNSWDIKFERRD